MHVYATTYPDSTKNAPTTTFTCDSSLSVNASFVQHAMKWPTAMYEMRKKRVESSAGMNGRFFFATGDAAEGVERFIRRATRKRPGRIRAWGAAAKKNTVDDDQTRGARR